MLYQIKCVLTDIKDQWIKLLFILVQLLVAMSLLCYIIGNVENYKLFEKKMMNLTEKNNIYMFHDKTEEFRFNQMVNDDELIKNMIELYNFMDNELNLTRYIADTSCSLIFNTSYPVPKESIAMNNGVQNQIKTLRITKDFISVFHLKGDFDLNLVVKVFDEYRESNKEIPVILGNKFKKYYNKGDILYDHNKRAYKIYGFFDKNSYYIAPDRIKSMEYLDNYIIMPCCITKDTEELTAAFQFLSSYYITDDKSQLYEIIEKTKELNLFSLKLDAFKQQCVDLQNQTIERILFNSVLLGILLIFSIIGFVGNIIQFISDSTREFAVNLLCGASESQIVLRVGIQIGLLIMLSNIAPFLLYGLSKASIITLASSILMGLLILIYPIVKINLQSIILMIRRNVE